MFSLNNTKIKMKKKNIKFMTPYTVRRDKRMIVMKEYGRKYGSFKFHIQ